MFSLFPKQFGMRRIFSRGNPPVNGPDIIAGLVLPHLGKVNAATLAAGEALSGSAAANLKAPAGSLAKGSVTQSEQGL